MITVLVGTCISWMQVQDAAHRHIPPEKLMGSAPFGPALPRSWFKAASYTTRQWEFAGKAPFRSALGRSGPRRQETVLQTVLKEGCEPQNTALFPLIASCPLPPIYFHSFPSELPPRSSFSIKMSSCFLKTHKAFVAFLATASIILLPCQGRALSGIPFLLMARQWPH